MGKVLFGVCTLLALCIGGLALVAYLGRAERTAAVDNLLAEDITRLIQTAEGRGEEIDLAAETDFPWDRVLVVAKDTPAARISAALGSEFDGTMNYTAESNGMFVFALGTQLARYADYRGRGSFEGFDRPVDEFRREDAVFVVRDLVVSPKRG
jgi:hypothetical protein